MKTKLIVGAAVLFIVAADWSFGQQPAPKSPESHKYRTIFTIVGGGGGFALGVFAGIGAFDDSLNASRKITTTALVLAAGGAIGSYFLGRALDKRKKSKDVVWMRGRETDELDRRLMRARWPAVLQDQSLCPPAGANQLIAAKLCYTGAMPISGLRDNTIAH